MKQRQMHNHLCLDKAYQSKSIEKEIIKRGYVPRISYKRKRGQSEMAHQINYQNAKKRLIERTYSWHNRFRKLFTRYEKKVENYLGLVQLSGTFIIH
jgi:hypothetical protein